MPNEETHNLEGNESLANKESSYRVEIKIHDNADDIEQGSLEETFHAKKIQEEVMEKNSNTEVVRVEPMECVSCEILDPEDDKELIKNSDFEINTKEDNEQETLGEIQNTKEIDQVTNKIRSKIIIEISPILIKFSPIIPRFNERLNFFNNFRPSKFHP